ncbi:tRNA splicing endonuclease subunit sen2 [Serendipita sp. 400]|nr:tRNA splicing endonuclease subunit sen2 [Serendipita sp. 400]
MTDHRIKHPVENQAAAPKVQRLNARLENERKYGQTLPRVAPKSWVLRWLLSWNPFGNPSQWDDMVIGVLDPPSCSVWVYDEEQQMTLWRKGFFGKGSLSRSEPTWLKREINRLRVEKRGGKELTAEEITAKRREIRKQFKQERANAIAAAEAEAELSFAANPESNPTITTVIPSAQTAGLQKKLQETIGAHESSLLPELTEDEIPKNMEHLQLSLQEAFFLAWVVGCLDLRSASGGPITLQAFWAQCFEVSSPFLPKRIDNPFLVHYVAYHHFRSLGWVVKSGIKFCVDFLLYKRGPVFHHAEFAVMIVPVYEDEADCASSPNPLPNSGPISWQWFTTVNRANAQVMKTLVLAHVIIPPSRDIEPSLYDSPEILSKFKVKEVLIRRFVASRMRD